MPRLPGTMRGIAGSGCGCNSRSGLSHDVIRRSLDFREIRESSWASARMHETGQ